MRKMKGMGWHDMESQEEGRGGERKCRGEGKGKGR
jgi:hypothetical protein